ncbi:MAG: hypothetical protein QOD92_3652 [Acidimicrobiaceae bacterium]
MTRRPPLYVWRVWLRLRADERTVEHCAELAVDLGRYDGRTRVEGGSVIVSLRMVGHGGPASAVGDAQQVTTHAAANAGLRNVRVDVVHAERIAASP